MGRDEHQSAVLQRDRLLAYLQRRFRDVQILEIAPLDGGDDGQLKDYGYGRPVRVVFRDAGGVQRIVIRTMTPDPFDHDRRADRAAAMMLAYDDFPKIPRHVQPLDVGLFDRYGNLASIPSGEPFLVTEYVDGTSYASQLRAVAAHDEAQPLDIARAEALAQYLVELHREPASPIAYQRALRTAIGSGEGIFGLCDAYPGSDTVAPPARLEAIERAAVRWRWTLRGRRDRRARRTHGDFHPFNLLFREGTDLSVLDCSRGAAGDPADDVTCLSINYLFFAWIAGRSLDGAYGQLWRAFWRTYLAASGDQELLQVVAPFFTWRALVLACPVWYPQVEPAVRERLLRFAERLLDGAAFDPGRVAELVQ